MLKKLHRNIHAIYGLAFFHSFMVIIPVIVPFFMSKGLSLAEIFYLQAIFASTVVILEAPSGYFADIFGRRNALLIGSVIHGLGYFYLNFTTNFADLIVFEIAVGISMSLISGADLALLYDTQKALEQKEELEHSSGIAHLGFTRSSAEALGALVGGAIAMWSFDLMVLMQSALAWICLILALIIAEPPYHELEPRAERLRLGEILRFLFNGDPILRRVVIAIPLYSLATFHVAWLAQPYWEQQGLTLAWFGVLWCAQSLTVAIANKYGFAIERRYGAIMALLVIGFLPIVGHFGMAILQGWPGIAIGLMMFACRGLTQVILVNALNRRVPSDFRATANSLTSFLFRLAFITTGPVIGYIAESFGMNSALLVLGISSIGLFLFVMIPLMEAVKGIRPSVAA